MEIFIMVMVMHHMVLLYPASSHVPTVGHDGYFYGAQHYQYPTPCFQPMTPTSGLYSSAAIPPKGENAPSTGSEQQPLTIDYANGNSNSIIKGGKGTTCPVPVRPTQFHLFLKVAVNMEVNGNKQVDTTVIMRS
ncbi:hypothetical protein SSX86_010861 [Deinandra increscens subsp. villosa]|uniref:Uncharacterized protein n=1 Tax=Deinandra increscens subsp. villosa TaxID=3103831 RepID=A0AAP0D8R4_9ASTR